MVVNLDPDHDTPIILCVFAAAEWYEDSVEVKSLSDFHNAAVLLRQCHEIAGHYSPGVLQVGMVYKLSCCDIQILVAPRLHSVGKTAGRVYF